MNYEEVGQEVMRQLHCSSYEELYESLNFNELRKILKHKFKTEFNCQTLTFLRKCYPAWKFCSWKFRSPLKNQWTDKGNCEFALRYIADQEGWTSRADYYKLNNNLIKQYIGSGLIDPYGGKLYAILMDIFPPKDPQDKWSEDYWIPWMVGEQPKGRSTPKGTFETAENRRWYVEWLCRRIGFSIPQDLHKLSRKEFEENYGKGMLVRYYNTSVFACLKDLFPEYEAEHLQWFNMSQKPKGVIGDQEERVRAMKYLREKMGWNTAEDFYGLSRDDFDEHRLGQLIYYKSDVKGFADAIIKLNPDLEFDRAKFNRHKTEQLVEKELAGEFQVETHYTIFTSSRGGSFKMDIRIPSIKVFIEIDGPQHFGQLALYQQVGRQILLNRDLFKTQEAMKKGYSVIRIIQEECFAGKSAWIREHLRPLLKEYPEPTVLYLETTEKNKGVYQGHKEGLCGSLDEGCLYG